MKFLPDEILHRNKRAEKKLAQKSMCCMISICMKLAEEQANPIVSDRS